MVSYLSAFTLCQERDTDTLEPWSLRVERYSGAFTNSESKSLASFSS